MSLLEIEVKHALFILFVVIVGIPNLVIGLVDNLLITIFPCSEEGLTRIKKIYGMLNLQIIAPVQFQIALALLALHRWNY